MISSRGKIVSYHKLIMVFCTLLAMPQPAIAGDEKPVDVIIVGAGLAGLSTAYRLKKAGLTYKVIEISPHLGGRIRTAKYPEKVGGEVGLEEFWVGNPTIEIMDELQIPKEKSATSFSSFTYKGKDYPFTQETNEEFVKSVFEKNELKKFREWDDKMISLHKQLEVRPLPKALMKLKDISFGDWVRKTGTLSKKAQEFIRIESEPEYATSWESISALDGILEWHIFSGPGTNSFHVIGGNQLLPEAIAKNIGMDNIVINTKVTRIESNADGVLVEGVDQGSYQHRSFRGKYAVTTPPLFRLLEIQFIPSLTDQRKQAIMTQTWGSYFTAHVILDTVASKFWGGPTSDVLPILSDSALGVIYGEASDDSQKDNPNILVNLLVCGSDAERFNLRAATAMDSVRQELTEAFDKRWPGISKHIKKFEFYQYHPRAIASWPVGRSRLDELSDLMREPQGRVYFAGDFTENTHSDGAAKSAVRVVNQIVKLEMSKK